MDRLIFEQFLANFRKLIVVIELAIKLQKVIKQNDICKTKNELVKYIYNQQQQQQQKFFYFDPMINPRQVVHFHIEHKPRHTNPTYNSSFVFGSLHAYGNTQYTKALLKDTQYKDHFDVNKKINSIVPTFNISRRAGPHDINTNPPLDKQNIDNKMTKSYLSTHGANLLTK